MILYKKILSYLLLSLHVFTSAHGSIPHNHDDNHHHEKHSHEHHSDDHHEHEGNHIISISHGIFHSVVHFIESLSHSHDVSDEPFVVESINLSHHMCGALISFSEKEALFVYASKCYFPESISRYSKIYLINSSLRGPPIIV